MRIFWKVIVMWNNEDKWLPLCIYNNNNRRQRLYIYFLLWHTLCKRLATVASRLHSERWQAKQPHPFALFYKRRIFLNLIFYEHKYFTKNKRGCLIGHNIFMHKIFYVAYFCRRKAFANSKLGKFNYFLKVFFLFLL